MCIQYITKKYVFICIFIIFFNTFKSFCFLLPLQFLHTSLTQIIRTNLLNVMGLRRLNLNLWNPYLIMELQTFAHFSGQLTPYLTAQA